MMAYMELADKYDHVLNTHLASNGMTRYYSTLPLC